MRLTAIAAIVLCISSALPVFAQNSKSIRILDKETGRAVSDAVAYTDNIVFAHSDDKGFLALAADIFRQHPYIIISCPGYRTDTLQSYKEVMLLKPWSNTLKEVIVRSSKVKRVFHSQADYIADYEVFDSVILLAAYKGALGDKGRLILIDDQGTILSSADVPGETVGFYKSCVNEYYYVSRDGFYSIDIDANQITTSNRKYDVALLPLLQQCRISYNDNFYYKYIHRDSFITRFTYAETGDPKQYTLLKLENRSTARASAEELFDILRADKREAARKRLLRDMWDNESLGEINGDIYRVDNTLVIFDFLNKTIHHYTWDGTPIRQVPMHIQWKTIKRLEVVRDEQSNEFYLHRFDNNSAHYLQRLKIHTGEAEATKINIEKPLVTRLKVYNGKLYYLYKNSAQQSALQLYTQDFSY